MQKNKYGKKVQKIVISKIVITRVATNRIGLFWVLLCLSFNVSAASTNSEPSTALEPLVDVAANTLPATNAELPAQNNQSVTDEVLVKKAENKPTFDVFEYVVDGNTVLPKNKIEETIYDYMGETKTIDDVEKARAALEKVYQDAGFLTVSVSIPQQEVSKGIVKLAVLEGTVERLRVTDAKYSSLAVIKERVAEFEEGKVPHFPTVQKQLGTVNRGANRQVAPILRPGKSPGKVEVDLKVQDQLPLHGNLELNDRYAPNTTKTRLNGSLRYENLWQQDHSVSLSFQVSPENTSEVKVLSGTYLIPRLNGDYFAMYGVLSDSDIAAVGDVNVLGRGQIVGARYIHPLPLVEKYYHTVTAGIDYKDFDESVLLIGADGFKTPIAYTAFVAGYDGTYQAEKFQTQVNLTLNFSTRGLGNDEAQFRDKRFLAEANYAYLKSDVKHLQKLPNDWALQARLSGQLASGPLIGVEQFTVGGVDSVRGYLESNSLGDDGIFGSMELRTPPFAKFTKNKTFNETIKNIYAFMFVDAGYVRVQESLPGQINSFDLISAGVGMKMRMVKGLYANLDYAKVMRTAGEVKDGDNRLHFRVGYDW